MLTFELGCQCGCIRYVLIRGTTTLTSLTYSNSDGVSAQALFGPLSLNSDVERSGLRFVLSIHFNLISHFLKMV